MAGKWPRPELSRDSPSLTAANSRPTSGCTRKYNCIAWAAGETFRNWWPDPLGIGYWPARPVPREVTTSAFVAAYETLNFRLCIGDSYEPGLEKLGPAKQ